MPETNQLSREVINEILDEYTNWLSYVNIVGIDVGQVHGDKIDGPTVYLLVDALKPSSLANANSNKTDQGYFEIPATVSVSAALVDRVPALRAGEIPVKVYFVEEIIEDELLDAEDERVAPAVAMVRPCPGGYFIRTEGLSGRGSLGTSIEFRGKFRMLSNNHVISKNGSVGKWAHQPAVVNGTNRLAKVTGFEQITYYATKNPSNPNRNRLDIAWCDSDPTITSQEVREIGGVAGMRDPVVGERIRMFGARTGSKIEANIASVTYRYRSKGSLGYSFWENGIRLEQGNLTQSGDSGSAYVAVSDSNLVALHRAGSEQRTVGCPLT
ncbi:hypothetical protein [Candidatus Thiodiazotropha sp. LNASS1]|uniref:hypothetical protein n=1 Tax=Candidatus Thiodiazotropha sp. LNASS1 TaxID=3096260 RepID=UPI0034DF497E